MSTWEDLLVYKPRDERLNGAGLYMVSFLEMKDRLPYISKAIKDRWRRCEEAIIVLQRYDEALTRRELFTLLGFTVGVEVPIGVSASKLLEERMVEYREHLVDRRDFGEERFQAALELARREDFAEALFIVGDEYWSDHLREFQWPSSDEEDDET